MPLQLTDSVAAGDLDPNGPYLQVKIVRFTLDSVGKFISLRCQYGNTVSEEWVPSINAGAALPAEFIVRDADYDTLVAETSASSGEVYYDKVAEKLYQWLIDNGHYAGTIV